jgi:hypothetical protein
LKSPIPNRASTQADLAHAAHRRRTHARTLAGWITLANALGLLVLALSSPAHAQGAGAYPRANTQPALQAADPQAPVPAVVFKSALTGLPRGVESQSTDWRSANDAVGQFKRGHIDLLKLENANPATPNRSQP